MIIRWMAGLLLSMSCVLAWAYSDREPPVEVDVRTVSELQGPTTFTIVAMEDQKDDRLFNQLASIVRMELTKRGYREITLIESVEGTKPALAVFLSYGIVDVEDFYLTPQVFTRELKVTILDAAAYAKRQIVKRYEAWTNSRGLVGDLAQVLPYQLKAVFYQFPGNASAHYLVTVKGMADNEMTGKAVFDKHSDERFLNADFPFASSITR